MGERQKFYGCSIELEFGEIEGRESDENADNYIKACYEKADALSSVLDIPKPSRNLAWRDTEPYSGNKYYAPIVTFQFGNATLGYVFCMTNLLREFARLHHGRCKVPDIEPLSS